MVTSRVLGLLIELGVLPVYILDTLQLGVIRSFLDSVRVECGLKLLLRDRVLHQVFLIPEGFIVQILLIFGGWDPFKRFQGGAPTFRGIKA
jgi:hypothetical protein